MKGTPHQLLIEALARYDTWASSTSMVERDLKQTSDLKQGRSEDTFLNMENDIIILKCDKLDEVEEAALIVDAQNSG